MARGSDYDTGNASMHEGRMAGEHGMSPRKEMGGADVGGSFGCERYSGFSPGGPEGDPIDQSARMLSEEERAAPPPVGYGRGKMPAQAAPDHGKHR